MRKKMKVVIVLRGEKFHGSNVIGVYAGKDAKMMAAAAARGIRRLTNFNTGHEEVEIEEHEVES